MNGKQIQSHRPGLHMDRRLVSLGPNLVRIEQTYTLEGQYLGRLITGPHWLFSLIRVDSGTAGFRVTAKRSVQFGRFFAMLLPAFSVVQFDWARGVVQSVGFLSDSSLPDRFGERAVAFVPDDRDVPTIGAIDDVYTCLAAGRDFVPISRPPASESLSARAKALLDREYRSSITMAAISAELGVAPATLSRQFKRDIGLTPLQYRHRVQIMEAVVRLAAGDKITDVAFDVGFTDLGRFYKQFGKYVASTPSVYSPDQRRTR